MHRPRQMRTSGPPSRAAAVATVAAAALLGAVGCDDYGLRIGPAADVFGDAAEPIDEAGATDAAAAATDSGAGACPNGMVFEVRYMGFTADPPVLSVPVGSTVRWMNMDPVAHTATEGPALNPAPAWSTGEIPAGGSAAIDFCEPASYLYFCIPHYMLMHDFELHVE